MLLILIAYTWLNALLSTDAGHVLIAVLYVDRSATLCKLASSKSHR